MADRIKAFVFPPTGQVLRAIQRPVEPWFFLSDACRIAALGNASQVRDRLDADEHDTIILEKHHPGNETRRGQPKRIIVSEPGLYNAMLGCRSKDDPSHPVNQFRRWVTHDVLTEIRATGSFNIGTQPPLPLGDGPSVAPAAQRALPPPPPTSYREAVEQTEFPPEWVTAPLMTKLRMLAEYRHIYGCEGAHWLCHQLRLPVPPALRQMDLRTPEGEGLRFWQQGIFSNRRH